MPVFVDIDAWINNFEREANKAGDKDRQKLVSLNRLAWQQKERDPNLSRQLLDQGYLLAQSLDERCWAMFYSHQAFDLTFYLLLDFKGGLELAVKNMVATRKPEYRDCPFRARVCRGLIAAYLAMDPVGYAEQTREALHYLETEVELDKETWRYIPGDYSSLASAFDQVEEAVEFAQRYLERSEGSHFRLTYACSMLCGLYAWQDNFDEVDRFGQLGEGYARRNLHNLKEALSILLLWQAVCRQKTGNIDEGKRLYITAISNIQQVGKVPGSGYLGALRTYYEACDDLERALKVADQRLEIARKSGSPHSHSQAHLPRCRLLNKMGLLREDDLATAREAAKALIDPSRFLAKLEKYQPGIPLR